MLNIMLGEVIFGGIGVGLTGMLVFVLITVFIAGLMVGRTPEYLGKKIDAFEMKMASLVILIPAAAVLVGAAAADFLRARPREPPRANNRPALAARCRVNSTPTDVGGYWPAP